MKTNRDILTAWMFCRECDKFNGGEHPERPCSGKPFDFVVQNDVKFVQSCNYNFDGEKLLGE